MAKESRCGGHQETTCHSSNCGSMWQTWRRMKSQPRTKVTARGWHTTKGIVKVMPWMVTVVVTVPKMVMSARLAPTRRGPAYGVRRRRSSGVSVSAQRTQLGAAVSQSAEMGASLSVTVWRMWVAGPHVAWRTAMTARVAGVACSSVQHGHCMVWLRTMQSKQRTRGGLVAPGSGRRWITSRATLVQRRPLVAPGH